MMPTQTILNSNSMAFQETSHNSSSTSTTISLKLAAKPVKVRRTRQPKNPQLSVARRNERERNRVKMVNNGFALLREHLPIEDLQECCESDGDTPDGSGPKGGPKAKKYSKVETLRAAIQRIRMLEDLIRATEPGFESINIMPSSNANSYDDEPLSCGSSGSPATVGSSSMHQQGPTSQSQFASQQAGGNCHQLYATNQQGQFIKLEPQHQQPTYNYTHQMPSPQDSQGSQASHHHHQQQQQTQVHQQQTQYSFQPETTLESMPSHTHLWIQQHQSSFMEQTVAANNEWYQQQQQQQQQFPVQHQQLAESPEVAQSQQQMLQQPEPIWFSGHSPTAAGQPTQNHPQSSPFNHPHQQHQISLYSQ